METLKITQTQSLIDRPERQRRTMKALGLRRMNQSVEHQATKQIVGMLLKVKHLVEVEKVD